MFQFSLVSTMYLAYGFITIRTRTRSKASIYRVRSLIQGTARMLLCFVARQPSIHTSTHFSWNMSRVLVHACKETAERRTKKKVSSPLLQRPPYHLALIPGTRVPVFQINGPLSFFISFCSFEGNNAPSVAIWVYISHSLPMTSEDPYIASSTLEGKDIEADY